jgi:DNA-binding NarL/FixJ family response regulator
MRVVILTSSPARAGLLRRMAGRGPFSVATASHPAEARLLLEDSGPTVLVCDERCEGFGWQDALDLAWALPFPAPVLVILSKFDAGTWLRVLRGGAGEIVCEPLTDEKLIGALRCAARLTPRRAGSEAAPASSAKARLRSLGRTLLGLGSRARSV